MSIDYVKELEQALARLTHRDTVMAQRMVLALSANYSELRWLEKDYEDEKQGDWTR